MSDTTPPIDNQHEKSTRKSILGLIAAIISMSTLILLIALYTGSVAGFGATAHIDDPSEATSEEYGYALLGSVSGMGAIVCILVSPIVSVIGLTLSFMATRQRDHDPRFAIWGFALSGALLIATIVIFFAMRNYSP